MNRLIIRKKGISDDNWSKKLMAEKNAIKASFLTKFKLERKIKIVK